MKYILNGLMALALVLMFTQCADNKSNGSTNNAPAAVSGPANMKIAYVEIDSLLTKYRFWNDLNEMMIKKEENIRTTLNEKAKDLNSSVSLKTTVSLAANVLSRKTCVSAKSSATCSSCRKSCQTNCRLKTRRTACSFVTLSTLS